MHGSFFYYHVCPKENVGGGNTVVPRSGQACQARIFTRDWSLFSRVTVATDKIESCIRCNAMGICLSVDKGSRPTRAAWIGDSVGRNRLGTSPR